MQTPYDLSSFALAALILVLVPGPNMAFCLSRTLCQGRPAGLISLAGVLTAYGVHIAATAMGLTALMLAPPDAFESIRYAGVAYLLYLAWRVSHPATVAPFAMRSLRPAPHLALFCSGFLVNLLNPKAVLFYVAVLPQFLRPEKGQLMAQSLQLGAVQVVINAAVMGLLVCGVSRLQPLLTRWSPAWQHATRCLLGCLFAALATRLLMVRLV